MHDITPTLRSLGLLESEVKVYLAALERGPSTVIDIADGPKLSRPATYTAIDTLTARGLMSTVQMGKRRLFAEEHPDRLLEYAKRRESELAERIADLQRALPELALRVGGDKPIVKVFEGKEGIHAIIEDLKQSQPKTLDEITNVSAMLTVLTVSDLAPLRAELQKIGARIRGLYVGPAGSSPISDARMLPAPFLQFKGDIEIYGDKVAFITFAGALHSVIIENAVIAQTVRTLFDLAWETAKAFPKPTAE